MRPTFTSRYPVLALAVLAGLACVAPRPPAPSPAPVASATAAAAAPAGPDRTTPPALGPSPELRIPPQEHFTLANGLAVRLVEYHRLPIVALHLVVDAGAARDPATLPGTAGFTAAMLTEGTKTRSAVQLSDETGALGASIGAGAGFDAAFLSGSTLSKHLPTFLDLFADVAVRPAFPRSDFERVRDQRKVTILQQRDQAGTVATKAFQPYFWAGSPYAHFLIGTEASLAATAPADLARFHDTYWRPGNATLVVVGDVTKAALVPLLEKALGGWKPGPKAAPLPPATPATARRTILIEKPDAPQTFLLMGMPGIPRSSPDFVATSVAFEVLGGGMSSRLFRNLREDKGYTYGIGAGADARKLGGATTVRGNVKADATGPALAELLKELARLRDEPVPEAELADARNAIVRGLPGDFATAGGIAGRVAELVVHGLPDDYWNRYADEIRQVTPGDVTRVARGSIDLNRLVVVMVGAPAVVKPQLAGLDLGPLEVRPPPSAEPAPPAPTGRPAVAPTPAAAPAPAKPGRPRPPAK